MRTKNRDLDLYVCDFLHTYRRRRRLIDLGALWLALHRLNQEQMILSTVALVLAIAFLAVNVRMWGMTWP